MRFRSIPQAVKEIKKQDPDTFISEGIIRNWVKRGVIHGAKSGGSGRWFVVDLDEIMNLLSN